MAGFYSHPAKSCKLTPQRAAPSRHAPACSDVSPKPTSRPSSPSSSHAGSVWTDARTPRLRALTRRLAEEPAFRTTEPGA
jgi:hypothetical protein